MFTRICALIRGRFLNRPYEKIRNFAIQGDIPHIPAPIHGPSGTSVPTIRLQYSCEHCGFPSLREEAREEGANKVVFHKFVRLPAGEHSSPLRGTSGTPSPTAGASPRPTTKNPMKKTVFGCIRRYLFFRGGVFLCLLSFP